MAGWQPPFDPQAAEADPNRKTHAVHIALLPHGPLGTVVFFSGNKWFDTYHYQGNVDHTAVMDYQSRTAIRPGTPSGVGGLAPNQFYDLFCCGHALLADGPGRGRPGSRGPPGLNVHDPPGPISEGQLPGGRPGTARDPWSDVPPDLSHERRGWRSEPRLRRRWSLAPRGAMLTLTGARRDARGSTPRRSGRAWVFH
jgi:hypothetical protein